MMNSARYFIADEVKLAVKEKAPPDAIYRDVDGRWHTFGEVVGANTRDLIEQMVAKLMNPVRVP
jgi:hypothetical protein